MKKALTAILTALALSCDCGIKTKEADCQYKQRNVIEICNNIDDNCDGITDNAALQSIPCGINNKGIQNITCSEGNQVMGECVDNDICFIDSEIPYYTGEEKTRNIGECKDGTKKCLNRYGVSSYYLLKNEILPQEELCDKLDNDCDGITDNYDKIAPHPCWENLPEQYRNKGICKNGWKGCNEDRCVGVVYPKHELCNGKDDDCDGVIDNEYLLECKVNDLCEEGFINITYSGQQETRNVGECKDNITICVRENDGIARPYELQKEVLPAEENCNFPNLDKNCNGKNASEEPKLNNAAIMFLNDSTGSFFDEFISVSRAICDFPRHIPQQLNYLFGLVNVPSSNNEMIVQLMVNYQQPLDFAASCLSVIFNPSMVYEIFYDGLFNISSPLNPLNLNPTNNRKEIYIMFTDGEEPWSVNNHSQQDVVDSIMQRNAAVYVFRPTGNSIITNAFENIVNSSGGAFYPLESNTSFSEIMRNLEGIISRCE